MNARILFVWTTIFLLCPPMFAQVRPEFRASELRNIKAASQTRYVSSQPDEFDVNFYRLEIRVTTSPGYVVGAVTMTAHALTDSLTSVSLDLSSTMTVDSVIMNSTRTNFRHSNATLNIDLTQRYKNGDVFSLTIYYQGPPQSSGFGSFSFSSHGGSPWVWSLSEPYGARDWWPCKDHPSDKADSVDISVTCDAGLKVGSNGRLVSITPHANGTHTYLWAERYPVATYLVSVALANYAEVTDWFHYTPYDSMQVLNYVLPDQLPTIRENLRRTVDMLNIFSGLYGIYPFVKEKYGHASFGWGGAMEHQTMSSMTDYGEFVVAHELSHQWFGDMITPRSWTDIWLNEGFATYSEALYAEQMYGPRTYSSYMSQMLEGAKRASGSISVQDTSSVDSLFNPYLVYDKGGATLHMLRHVLGDSLFFRALKAYANDPTLMYASASTADFQKTCEAVSGKPLHSFFQQWIYGKNYPTYAYGWTARSTAGRIALNLQIAQTSDGSGSMVFVMPIDVRVSGAGWDTTITVMNDAANQDYTFLLPRMPSLVQLDPDGWILKDAVNVNGEPAIPMAYALGQNYPNPFNAGTSIPYAVLQRSNITITIFSVLGEKVATIVEARREVGRYVASWVPPSNLSSGVYFCRLQANDFFAVTKMVLMK